MLKGILLTVILSLMANTTTTERLKNIGFENNLTYHTFSEISSNYPLYDGIEDFKDGLCVVQKGEKCGYLNTYGDIVIPEEYEYAKDFSDGFAVVKKDGKYGVIDKQNNLTLPFEYENLENYGNGRFLIKKDGKYGLVDKIGKTVVAFEYDFIDNKYSDVIPNSKKIKSYYIAEKDSYYGVIDKDGIILLPFDYDGIWCADEETVIVMKDEKFAVVKTDGTYVYDFGPKGYSSIGGGYLSRGGIFEKVDLCTTDGKIIVEKADFHPLQYINDDVIISNKDGAYGTVDKNGNITLNFEYDELKFYTGEYLRFEKDGEKGLINNLEEITFDFDYSKYPYIDKNGDIYALSPKCTRVNIYSSDGIIKESYEAIDLKVTDNFIVILLKDYKCAIIKK